jgi:uroporphyrinogen III methyltransferase/synthase
MGAIVDDVASYQTVGDTDDPTGAGSTLIETGADWVTFTSASTAEHFHARFDLPGLLKKHPSMKIASIGPETSKALASLGVKWTIEANPHTVDGLVEALVKSGSAA